MSGDMIRAADAMQMAEASYARGQRDVLLSTIDAINSAQEHGAIGREVAEVFRQFVNGIMAMLPPEKAMPGQEGAK